ncbi:MAG: hypothetical protein OQK00_09335 [Rhodobacteraceae bacterium]|nr:hypothetical protein [Paracoccaceae bacterium]MCW9041741.1 hypothetical protein [Pseudopelagicola sp.]
MSATLLSDLPQTICNRIDEVLPDLKTCEPHAGKFSLEELKKSGVSAPAVLVSVLGAKQGQTFAGPAHSFNLSMAAYVVTRDQLGLSRDVAAANICQLLMALIPDETWGFEALGAAANLSMVTLVSSSSRNLAVSLWAVTWDQPISFFQPDNTPLGVELYVAHVPEGEAGIEGDYTRVGGHG